MYNSDHDEINDVGEGDGEGGEVGGAGGEGRDTATGIRTVSGDDDPSSDQWWTTIENHCFQWLHPTITFNDDFHPQKTTVKVKRQAWLENMKMKIAIGGISSSPSSRIITTRYMPAFQNHFSTCQNVFVRFGKTKGEIWVEKGDFRGDLGGF